ncbi:MAG: hypothetical protein K5880_11700 [Hydrogenophaga sp.]|nr:hypothetical protein [Hydrogenophaga sp.]
MDRNYISLIELGKNSPSVRLVFKHLRCAGSHTLRSDEGR